jgi:DNA invertase Pin-like site-specific DNA recombinase
MLSMMGAFSEFERSLLLERQREGVSQARLSCQIGVPLSRSGRQRKIGRSLGCCWVLVVPVAGWWAARFLAG